MVPISLDRSIHIKDFFFSCVVQSSSKQYFIHDVYEGVCMCMWLLKKCKQLVVTMKTVARRTSFTFYLFTI